MHYRIEIAEIEGGNWTADIPELTGCRVQAADRTEAVQAAQVRALRTLADLLNYGELRLRTDQDLEVRFTVLERAKPRESIWDVLRANVPHGFDDLDEFFDGIADRDGRLANLRRVLPSMTIPALGFASRDHLSAALRDRLSTLCAAAQVPDSSAHAAAEEAALVASSLAWTMDSDPWRRERLERELERIRQQRRGLLPVQD
jgi:predicted RNase H-like HicB family nuclease